LGFFLFCFLGLMMITWGGESAGVLNGDGEMEEVGDEHGCFVE
jgi:hypothetical protein